MKDINTTCCIALHTYEIFKEMTDSEIKILFGIGKKTAMDKHMEIFRIADGYKVARTEIDNPEFEITNHISERLKAFAERTMEVVDLMTDDETQELFGISKERLIQRHKTVLGNQ